jgi:uncharacterized protein YqeY
MARGLSVTGVEPAKSADDDGTRLRAGLAAALKDAIRARDQIAASALRTTLGAIANAEAVAPGTRPRAVVGSPHFVGAVAGLGAGEVARRELSGADVRAIVVGEIAERVQAAAEYTASGLSSQAERLHAEARILNAVVVVADVIRGKDQQLNQGSVQKNGSG